MPISRRVLLAGLLSASGAYFLPRHSVRAASGLTTGIVVPLQWSLFAGAPMLIQALTADAVDVGVIGDAPLVFAQAGASPIKAVAAIQTDGTMTAVIVRKDSPIRSVKDLKGRSVATLKSQTGHYLMLAALREAGLRDDDVRFVFIPPAAARMALQTGSVDAWATWGPYIAEAKINDGAREIVNGGHLMSGLSYVVATTAELRTRRDDIIAYTRLLRDGHQWMLTHEEDYATAWGKETGLSLPVAREVVRTMKATVTPIDPAIIQKQQFVSSFMTETKMIPATLDAGNVVDSSVTF
ncbi:aliphatic sulfonate ABC transporter substrate-binding protein [Acetobacter oeni]|uniref:Putative aliphatic sulfonates-binding protein n=1 Tax=Acetobacter oeni TaxID=304077 RepID=A0A511XJX4_9PROT|nr:aliphatic sulfonate ABC transporter substrate-binding protein [Acetobacter oeni]MBB3883481.1 sulfonate transport system substrate-binding protein [Acetobacter oeni]NHO19444.1 aliphatic sulfonate ABC transporter substrate-binding protein [Acetobacter oeni]GBR04102.1 nitrate/sulfonate/bicarbonate ABC transporter substrate-binding periplasmic protein [Acetobacter oeni LMG 21952]GEN63260.1 sulfonate ABC transporter substrate-binding protein [Acetobacter oeni]